MGGLALGNALIGWYGHRISRFLRTYAILEAVVAVTGLALTYALPEVTRLFVLAARAFGDLPWLMNMVRLVIAFAMLMVPATAMGATLPVLVGALCRWRGGFGRALGRLYGWNTLGAVAGVLGAEIVLIARVGVIGSAWCAALLNLGAAAAALWISRRTSESQPVLEAAAARLLACAFLAGSALMALEVVWFRFLSMFVINSTFAISLMLAVVLAAIGLGGLTASTWLRRRPHALTYLPALALAAGCVSAGSYVSFQFLSEGPWTEEWYRIFWFACSLTFATSLLSGIIFTLLGEALERGIGIGARAAGWLTLANTTGAMCGPLIATFVLLPVLGMERAFFALAALYGAIGLLAMRDTLPALSTAAGRAFVVAALATGVVLGGFPFGLMARHYFVRSAELYATDGSQMIATREGPTETTFLMQQTWLGKPVYHRLVTNGFSMSGTHMTGQRYMRYFVYWPMLLRQAPLRRVLIICYGVGVTAAAVTDVDSVESIDVVEISRDVISMSDLIYAPAEHPLRDRRMRVHLEDGRQFLQVTDQQFDLITGEPPPPLTPGTVNLYTREYFQLIYDRLAQGGITTYWLPVARRGEYDVMPIIRAFCDVFEDCSLWNGTPFDWMLVGTRHAQGPASDSAFSTPWNHPALGPHLREIGFEIPQQIGATFLGDASYLKALVAETPALTDDYPRRLVPVSATSLSADSRNRGALDLFRTVIDPARARRRFEHSTFIRSLWPEGLRNDTLPFFDHQDIINRTIWEGANPLRYIEALHSLLTRTSLRRLPLWELGSNDALQRVADTGNDGTGMVEYQLGARALAIRNYSAAGRYLAESERRGLHAATLRPLRVYALCLAGELDAARRLAPDVVPGDPDERHFWEWLRTEFGV
jgi:spermidine synthase